MVTEPPVTTIGGSCWLDIFSFSLGVEGCGATSASGGAYHRGAEFAAEPLQVRTRAVACRRPQTLLELRERCGGAVEVVPRRCVVAGEPAGLARQDERAPLRVGAAETGGDFECALGRGARPGPVTRPEQDESEGVVCVHFNPVVGVQ